MRFRDRADGGKRLAVSLKQYAHNADTIVVGLPRGGVVTAYEVAHALGLPLDILVVRKIGAPMQPELALGAITQQGDILLDEQLMRMLGVQKEDLDEIIARQMQQLQRRLEVYRGDRPPLDLNNKTVVLVDDGLATGATMLAAIMSAKKMGAHKIVVAVPVAPLSALKKIRGYVDDVVCLDTPEPFWGVGAFYDVFAQTDDQEVINLLR